MQRLPTTTARAVRVASPVATTNGDTGTQTSIVNAFPPELMRMVEADPRFAIATLDGRWLDPFTGEAIPAPQGLRIAALRRLATRQDWRQRPALGMGELAVRKHFHDLEGSIPRDERLRVIETASGCWVNPYSGRVELTLRVDASSILTPEKRLVMARILTRTPEMRGPIRELSALINGERRVLPLPSATGSTATISAGSGTRTASAVFRQIPKIPGWQFGIHHSSHHAVGGDFYEIHPLDDQRLLIVLGDVSGHGMQGAQAATVLLKQLRRSLHEMQDLPHLANELNQACAQFLGKGKFITLFLALLNPENGEGSFVACGHHRPLIIAPGREHLASMPGGPSMALGLTATATFQQRITTHTFSLRHGDWLVQCSDGVIEASREGDDELFGITRYAGRALTHADDDAQKMVQGIADAATRYAGGSLDDDCTILAIRRLAPQRE
ncbi:MAG: serine/threonine-protein phosphatase [Planctomycetota bacterium]|nr:MAG: serine/threonine-protein phosphatase [Planctomycetota bacterium]